MTGELDPIALDGDVTEGSGFQKEVEIQRQLLGANLLDGPWLHLILSGLLSVLPVYGDLAQHSQAVLGRDLDVLGVQAEQTECRILIEI